MSHRRVLQIFTVLQKGLKYAIEPKKPPIEDIVADLEVGINGLSEDAKEEVRLVCKKAITNFNTQRYRVKKTTRQFSEAVKTLKEKDCFYVKADKGNRIVILDKSDYNNRMLDLLSNGPYIKLQKDPLKKMEREIDAVLKKYENNYEDPLWRRKLKVNNPSTPRLYGLPKIHKPGKKMREISDNTTAPSYKLSKWILSELEKLPQPEGNSVKNSYDFIKKTKDIILKEDEILISFDVSALFPSVPIKETLELLESWLNSCDIADWLVEMYLECVTICMDHNIFTFNNDFFKQTNGTTMGNSLSPFLANFFLSHFERKIKNHEDFPRVWYRYVDDIFAVIPKHKIEKTLDLLNSQYDTINFTYETEENSCLPFLDLKVIRNNENKLEYDIFRKPTNTPRFIPSDSFHALSTKFSAFNSMAYRLVNVPLSKERFAREKDYILKLAAFNHLNTYEIEKIIRKQIKKKQIKECTLVPIDKEPKKYIKLTYFPIITNKVSKVLKKHNLHPAWSTKKQLKSLLGSTKDKIDDLKKSGVYEIPCEGCNAVYIGMTSRNLLQRFKDHESDIRNHTERTALAKHVKSENTSYGRGRRKQKSHGIKIENMKLLKQTTNYKELAVWESIYIRKNKGLAVNDNLGLVDSSLLQIF